MARYARKRKSSKRTTRKRTRSKRATGRRRLRKGKIDSSNSVGVSRAIWATMTPAERLLIMDKSQTVRSVAIQSAIHKAALRGKPFEKLQESLAALNSATFEDAKNIAAQSGTI